MTQLNYKNRKAKDSSRKRTTIIIVLLDERVSTAIESNRDGWQTSTENLW